MIMDKTWYNKHQKRGRKKLTSLHSRVKIKSSRGLGVFGFRWLNAYPKTAS